MTEKWAAKEIVQRSVAELIPYDRNPKDHPEEQISQIANSIRQWGWTMPILIDEVGTVIAGHGRLYAAQSMGVKEVPCVVATDWSEEQKKAYVIADNKIAENGKWNMSKYFEEVQVLEGGGFDLTLMGLDGDFSFATYKPNLDPVFSGSDVSAADLGRAASAMDAQIANIQEDKSVRAKKVTCPYCAASFRADI
jgi:ParB-like chromosome segregation protein Spo0J